METPLLEPDGAPLAVEVMVHLPRVSLDEGGQEGVEVVGPDGVVEQGDEEGVGRDPAEEREGQQLR